MPLITERFAVQGMTCASCANSVESMLKSGNGIENAIVNFADESVQVQYHNDQIKVPELKALLQQIGYDLIIEEQKDTERKSNNLRKAKNKMWWALALASPVFVLSMFFMGKLPYSHFIEMALTLGIMIGPGQNFYINAAKRAKHLQANMDTLVAISTAVAFIFSFINAIYPQWLQNQGLSADVYFESAAVIIAFILVGKYLEEKAKHQSGEAIQKLMHFQAKEVTAIRNGQEVRLPIEEIIPFDRIVIKAGERIPVDGKVIKGHSFVDESMVNGEAIPIEKNKGDILFAGTVSQNGHLTMLAEKVGANTLLGQIIETVRNAQGSKAPAQKMADKIASIFVPSVLILALITFFLWIALGGISQISHAISAAVAVLIIACPCALGLATPTALMVGIGKAAEHSILIKDANHLEMLAKVDTLVFDKTGTITQGNASVSDFIWFQDTIETKQALLAISQASDHPLSKAVSLELKNQIEAHQINLADPQTIQGKGIQAEIDHELYFVGSSAWLHQNIPISNQQKDQITSLENQGKTLVCFFNTKTLLAVAALQDPIKKNSTQALAALKVLGLSLHMLTGDHEKAAALVANQTGIDNYAAKQLPADKSAYIKQLSEQKNKVAMIGDGINDAEALALADVSIAMGKGTDIAIDVAGITLITGDLSAIHQAIHLARRTVKTIRQNLFWAFAYNVLCIPIAAGILYPFTGFMLNPMIAGAAMALSSVTVVLNSLRLKNLDLSA